MRRHRGPQCKPPWWPANEPWPPAGSREHWRAGRSRFFRRVALFVVIMGALSIGGMVALLWLAATGLGLIPSSTPPSIIFVVGAFVVVAVLAAGLFSAIRRIAMPFGGVMEAADRVAAGNYTVRVAEKGPPPIRAMARSINTMIERLQDNDRVRRDLMADIAHELRTPLTIMQGKLEGLLDGVYSADDRQLRQLLDETHVLSRLVEDLRTLALAESGALKLQKEPTDIAGLARDTVAGFAVEAAERGVQLLIDAPDDLAPIDLDPIRIREVIGNLLSNALRHTPTGGSIGVTVRASQGPNSESRLAVEVRDSGAGMTAEDLAHAFDRFYKGSKSRGSGLGLTIARNLVAAHGGEIRASSEPAGGTTITFVLPSVNQ